MNFLPRLAPLKKFNDSTNLLLRVDASLITTGRTSQLERLLRLELLVASPACRFSSRADKFKDTMPLLQLNNLQRLDEVLGLASNFSAFLDQYFASPTWISFFLLDCSGNLDLDSNYWCFVGLQNRDLDSGLSVNVGSEIRRLDALLLLVAVFPCHRLRLPPSSLAAFLLTRLGPLDSEVDSEVT